MQIINVSLEDIKNYVNAEFTFESGTNAISGPNGVGKTTIIEAIAYALFDYLPYKKEDFARRGAKQGTVRVKFLSALDERCYTVVRNTANGYYVHDDILKIRPAEQKSDTLKWLHEHLGLEPNISLPDLFETTIGVPQGTFTVDFKKTAAARKMTFDKILRVEEYQQAANKLLELQRLCESKAQEIQTEIAGYEGQLKQMPELCSYAEQLRLEIQNSEETIARLDQEYAVKTAKLSEFDRQAEQINQFSLRIDKLTLQKKHEEQNLLTIANEWRKAQAASDILVAAEAAHQAYLAAAGEWNRLDLQRKERDELQNQLNLKEKELTELRTHFRNLRDQIRQSEVDKAAAAELDAAVQQQLELEQRLNRLQGEMVRLQELRTQFKTLTKEKSELDTRLIEIQKKLATLDQFQSSAEKLVALEADLNGLEKNEHTLRAQCLQQQHWAEKKFGLTTQIAELDQKLTTIQQQIRDIEPLKGLANQYDRLISTEKEAQHALADLKAQVKKDKETLKQIKGGLCPFLLQECRNLKAGQTLEDFFKAELTDHTGRIAEAEEQLLNISRQLTEAREARLNVEQLKYLGAQETECLAQKQTLMAAAASLEQQIASQPVVNETTLRQLTDEIARARQGVEESRAAKNKYEQRIIIQQQLEQMMVDQARKQRSLAEYTDQISPIGDAESRTREVQRDMQNLNDPRSKQNALLHSSAQLPQLKEKSALVEAKGKTLHDEVEQITRRLNPFSDLDIRLAQQQQEMSRCEANHQRYTGHEAIARTLPEWNARYEQAKGQFAAVENDLQQQMTEAQKAGEHYQAKIHEAVKVDVLFLHDQLTANRESHRLAFRNQQETAHRITFLREVEEKRQNRLQTLAKYQKQSHFIDFTRDTLKEAGPQITAVYQANVSLNADRIFREITGKPYMGLRWSNDYEILIEEDGRDRSFNNLSGGEQMAAALAIRLALLREMSDIDIAFFDEPTTNMDEVRRRNLAEQIRQIRGFTQLFVISHDDTFERVTDHVIRIEETHPELGLADHPPNEDPDS